MFRFFCNILAVVIALETASCAQYEAQQREDAAAAAQARIVDDDAQCQSYGVQPGTPSYVQCRMNLDSQHAADFQQRRALAAQIILNH